MLNRQIIILSVIMLCIMHGAMSASVCYGINFSPCKCNGNSQTGVEVICDEVLMTEVKQMMGKVSSMINLTGLNIYMNKADVKIPSSLLGTKVKTAVIAIYCKKEGVQDQQRSLESINETAFSNTKDLTGELVIESCNMTSFSSFKFLQDFQLLKSIQFSLTHIPSTTFGSTLPSLPGLTDVLITRSSGLAQLEQFPSFSSVNFLDLSSNLDMTTDSLSLILGAVALSSANTLRDLYINENQLSALPSQQTALFNGLSKIEASNNDFAILPRGSITFSPMANEISIHLENSAIETIESGAFQGNFDSAFIHLEDNLLTRLESSAFEKLLLEFAAQPPADPRLLVMGSALRNPFDCENELEHFRWIVVDQPELLAYMDNATCTNGTALNQLDPFGFPEPTTSTVSTQASMTEITTSTVSTEDPTTEIATLSTTAQSTFSTVRTTKKTPIKTTASTKTTPSTAALIDPAGLVLAVLVLLMPSYWPFIAL